MVVLLPPRNIYGRVDGRYVHRGRAAPRNAGGKKGGDVGPTHVIKYFARGRAVGIASCRP